MGGILKFEVKRVITSIGFKVAVSICILLWIAHLVTVTIPYGFDEGWGNWRSGEGGIFPLTIWNIWIGTCAFTASGPLLFYLAPFLAVMPNTANLRFDIDSGLMDQITIEVSPIKYIAAKAVASFIAGVAPLCFTLIADLLFSAMFFPALAPDPTAVTFSITAKSLFGDLFYSNPFLWTAAYLGVVLVVMGAISITTIPLSAILGSRLAACLVAPMLCMVLLGIEGASPVNLIWPARSWGILPKCVLLCFSVVVVLNAAFYIYVNRHSGKRLM